MRYIKILAISTMAISLGCGDNGKNPAPKPTKSQLGTGAQQPVTESTIPLNEIWAMDIPGTRPMNRLRKDGKYLADEGQLLDDIRKSLKALPPNRMPRPGFVVSGAGMEALQKAHSILTKNDTPERDFPEGSDISAIFFSHQAGRYARLDKVSRAGTNIDIGYHFDPHITAEVTEHFAIIPLGTLPAGDYYVSITQYAMRKQPDGFNVSDVPRHEARRIVCQPFSFSVVQQGDKP